MAVRGGLLRVEGLREAQKRVDDVGLRAQRPEPALRAPRTLLDLQESERRRFSTYRFRPAQSREWQKRKRREGLDPRTMHATNRLSSAFENAVRPVRRTVFNKQMTWGIPRGRSDLYYATVQARRGRQSAAIDRIARERISMRVQEFLAHGFLT